jgi:subtilisin-like proprotein convertase family protein
MPSLRKLFPILAAGILAHSAGRASAGQETSAGILLRKTDARVAAEPAWQRSLKPRAIPAKKAPISPPGTSHRLIVKFADDFMARADRRGSLTLTADHPGKVSALQSLAESLKLSFRPLNTASETAIEALRKRAASRTGTRQPDLSGIVEVLAANSSPATILSTARALHALEAVEYVEIESIDAPPPPPAADIAPATPALVSYQTYRGQSQGIGVDYVRDTHGIRGHPSLRFTDCEYQFNPQHEDLSGLVTVQPGVTSMFSSYGDNHGTASIGIIGAGENGYGVSGTIQNSQLFFYPELAAMQDGSTQQRAATIIAALADSGPGDIVMLEMQSVGPGGSYAPAEYDISVWNAVKTGTDAGVIVVAAAGNQAPNVTRPENLDSSSWAEYRSRGDSGAIIVGAGSTTRSRLSFSTYGSRVNLQGWGSGVATTGYGNLMTCGDDPNQKYTDGFSGTSSATAIVASAAALAQSVAIERLGTRLTPEEMRALLVSSGQPQTGDLSKRIGPLPDLTAAVPQLLAKRFKNSASFEIPDAGLPPAPPSSIQVSGVDGLVTAVRVGIEGLSHGTPMNLDVFLVSPDGKVALLMSDAGRTYRVSSTSLLFDDSASSAIPETTAIVPGRYRPANYQSSDVEAPPAGSVGPIGNNLNALAANGANGEWKLYVVDDHAGDTGSIASWSISFETTPYPSVELTADSVETAEGGPATTVTATLSATTSVDVTLPFTVTGSASETADFNLTPGPILIPAGQASGSITLAPVDDAIDEENETIVVTLGEPIHATAEGVVAETVTLADNDVTLHVASDFGPPPPPSAGTTYTAGTEITVTETDREEQPGTHHFCSGWTGTGSAPPEGTGCTATFIIREDSTITWHWNTEHLLQIGTNGAGSVDTAGGWIPQGAQVVLSASGNPGHHFAGWSVLHGAISEGTPESSQISVTMDQPVSLVANFLPNPVGAISLETDPAPAPGNGDTATFGNPVIGTAPVVRTFTVRNTGNAPLPGTRLTLDAGPNAAFALTGASTPADIAPGESLTFALAFTPPSAGSFTGSLTIACDDPAVAPFQFGLTGSGQTARQAYEEWLANATPSAGDGIPDLLKYAFNLSETGAGSRTLSAAPDNSGLPCLTCEDSGPTPVFRLEFVRRKNSGLLYTPLQMPEPGNRARSAMTGSTVVTDIDSNWERVSIEQPLNSAEPRRFFTVEVTLPDSH